MQTPLKRAFGSMVLIAIAIINPPSARAQGILRDHFRAANRGALPEPTTLNVPGRTVRIPTPALVGDQNLLDLIRRYRACQPAQIGSIASQALFRKHDNGWRMER